MSDETNNQIDSNSILATRLNAKIFKGEDIVEEDVGCIYFYSMVKDKRQSITFFLRYKDVKVYRFVFNNTYPN